MEKKRAERERQKLEKEEKKKQQGNASSTTTKLNVPGEEEDIIGNLMKEIRRGKTLRRRSEAQSGGTIQPSRSGYELKQDDVLRLQKIYEQSTAESIEEKPEDSAHNQINGNGTAAVGRSVTPDSHFLSVNYRKDRTNSEAFAGVQHGRNNQVRHSFHYLPHYETTV